MAPAMKYSEYCWTSLGTVCWKPFPELSKRVQNEDSDSVTANGDILTYFISSEAHDITGGRGKGIGSHQLVVVDSVEGEVSEKN